MSTISATFASMRDTISFLQEENDRFCQAVRELVGTEEELSGMWQGDANAAFRAAFQSDQGQWDVFATLIKMYITTLSQIVGIYEQAEQNNVGTAAGRSYGIGGAVGPIGGNIGPGLTPGILDQHVFPQAVAMYAMPMPNLGYISSQLGDLSQYITVS